MERCVWDGCGKPLEYRGRGRPAKYCPDHAKANKRRLDNSRQDYGRTRKLYPACCADAQDAKVKTYGGGVGVKVANIRTCEQHQQWQSWYGRSHGRALARRSEARAEKTGPELVEVKRSKSFRLTFSNPDDYLAA